MAGKGPLLNSLLALVAGFDTGAWEALANKGLVRRAQKDLEAAPDIAVTEEAALVRFKIPPYEVTMPAPGPAKATCTCPARGVCQHILVAGMWLQKSPPDDQTDAGATIDLPSREEIEAQMLEFTQDALEKWAGIGPLREAQALAAKGKIGGETSGTVTVNFPDQGIETRFAPGGGLDGIIVTGSARNRRQAAAVAAVLCVQLAHVRQLPATVAASRVLEEATQAPRTRAEILDAVQTVIEEAVQVGLTHVSSSLQDRLQTMAMSAQATNLPRLSRMLRALVDETGAIVGRLGRASEATLLLAMARTHALVRALKNPAAQTRSDLIGVHRTQYEEVSRLDLLGAAAYPWQTPSGYMGLTILYWEQAKQSWYSWTDARPSTQAAGFNAVSRFGGSGPWEGIESPEQSARSRIALISPKRNPEGRLSSSCSTKGMVLGSVSPSEFDFGSRLFTDWTALRASIPRVLPIGLRELHPLDLIVVLQPYQFGRRWFDEQRQLFQWEIIDQNGSSFPLVIPWREWTADAIKCIESLKPSAGDTWRIVAKIIPSEIGLAAEPLSIHPLNASDGRIVHLAFSSNSESTLPKTSTTRPAPDASRESQDDYDPEETEDSKPPIPRIVESLLNRIEKEIEQTAESGTAARDPATLLLLGNEAQRLGLTPLTRLLNHPVESPSHHARLILRLRYLCSLYRQSAAFV